MGPPAGRDEGWAQPGTDPAFPSVDEPEPGSRPDDGPVRRSHRLMAAGWLGAVAAWVAFSLRGDGRGWAVALGVTFVLALVARFLYLRVLLGRDRPWRVWSPWLFVVAAILAVLPPAGAEIRDRNDRPKLNAAEEADWIEGCRSGGIRTYDDLPASHPTRVTFTRAEIVEAMDEFCAAAAERGYASDEAPSPEEQQELNALMQEILADVAGT